MRKSRFTAEQIVAILQEHAAGASPADLIRRHNISRHTFYQWKKRFGDLKVNEAKRLRTLEDEHARLTRLVAEQALRLQVLRDVLGKGR